MKKKNNIFLVVLATIFVFSFLLTANANTVVKLGDVNNNGKCDSIDYLILKRAYFGLYTLNDVQKISGDCNQNGKIDSNDYMLLKRAYFDMFIFQNPDVVIPSESETPKYEDDGYYTEVVKP